MYNFLRPLLASVLLLLVIFDASAQLTSIPSPTAANLGLYGEMPVSYYTGTPNITIPLYEIKGKNVSVPIALTYHPSAIRPEIHPGPTGLGWTLQAGGVITRSVRGASPDEFNIINNSMRDATVGYLAAVNGWIAGDNWKNRCRTCKVLDPENCDVKNREMEPDEFSFSLPGLTGKFYFDHHGQIQAQCDRPVKIIFSNEYVDCKDIGFDYSLQIINYEGAHMNEPIKEFTIIDEFGNKYYFGGSDAIEYSDPIAYGSTTPALGYLFQATSWYLKKIESADGLDVVDFEYERGPFISQLYKYIDGYYNRWYVDRIVGRSVEEIFKGTHLEYGGLWILPVYLKRITKLRGETISFTLSKSNDIAYTEQNYKNNLGRLASETADYKLLNHIGSIPRLNGITLEKDFDMNKIQWLKFNDITIKDERGELFRTIQFEYIENQNIRLFLSGLKIRGASANALTYRFSYKDKENMPPYLECITDHWGFYNAARYTERFVYELKEPNALYADKGVLSDIWYPTGGKVHFEYELHDYSKVVNTKDRSIMDLKAGQAGGLRISRIETDDLHGNKVTRKFFYKLTPTSNVSSGVLNVAPSYVKDIEGYDCSGQRFNIYHICSKPFIPLAKENDGLYIGYTAVCEQIEGEKGYIQHVFSNHDNGHQDLSLSEYRWNRDIFPSDPWNSRFFERGRLLEEHYYTAANKPVKSSYIFYNRYGSLGDDNPRAFWFEVVWIGFGHFSVAPYLHYTYKFLPSRRVETTYDLNGKNPHTTNIDYSYNNEYLLEAEIINDSEGNVMKKVYRYPKDIVTQMSNSSQAYNWMFNNYLIASPVERLQYKNNKLIDASFTSYSLFAGKPYPANDLVLATDQPITDYDTLNIDSRLVPKVSYERYDTRGNLLQARSTDSIPQAYLWSYGNSRLVAIVKGASYDELVNALGGSSSQEQFSNTYWNIEALCQRMQALRASLPSAIITSYTHHLVHGITSTTDPAGITTYYEYDSLGRLFQVKDHQGYMLEKFHYHYNTPQP